MSKYEPLTDFLAGSKEATVELTFREIERIIDAKLPASAYNYRALWSNNPVGHVMTQAWLAAGYESEQVDMERRRVVFRRTHVVADQPMTQEEKKRLGRERLKQLMGCMAGTVRIPDGVDIMEPVELEWAAETTPYAMREK